MSVSLPEPEVLFELINKIASLIKEKILLEVDLKLSESEISKEARINPRYFENLKPLSQTSIDNTWKFTGFENELISKRIELATITAELERAKLMLAVHRDLIGLFRTQAANERTPFV